MSVCAVAACLTADQQLTSVQPSLRITNASATPAGTRTDEFQVSSNDGFTVIVASAWNVTPALQPTTRYPVNADRAFLTFDPSMTYLAVERYHGRAEPFRLRLSMTGKGPAHPERSFGVSVGGVAVAVAAYLWWRGSIQSGAIVGAIGLALVVLGLLAPRALYWPSVVWWKLVHLLGYINARIILTVLFSVLLVPIGLFWRLTGKDPLGRRRASGSGWSAYPARYRDPKHYSRMY